MNSILPSQLSKGISTLSFDMILVEVRKRRFFTLSIISWLVIAILTVVVVVPQVQQVFVTLEALREKQIQLTALENRLGALNRVDTSTINAQMEVLQTALPPQKPVLPLLYSLDKLAGASQVAIGNFQISPGNIGSASATLDTSAPIASTLGPNVFSLPLKMDISGSFSNMNQFFKTLDAIVPLVHVTSIQFSPENATDTTLAASSSAQFRAEVSLDSLYAKIETIKKSEETLDKVELTPEETAILDRLTQSFQEREADTQASVEATDSARTNFFKL